MQFFGQETGCGFGNDARYKHLGTVTVPNDEYRQKSSHWPFIMLLLIFIVAGLLKYFAL